MRFNCEITFQQQESGVDSYGQPLESWTDAITRSAEKITTSGREFYAAQKLNAETSAVFKLWYEPGIDVKMRIKQGDKYFNILSLNNVNEQNQFLLISAKEVI